LAQQHSVGELDEVTDNPVQQLDGILASLSRPLTISCAYGHKFALLFHRILQSLPSMEYQTMAQRSKLVLLDEAEALNVDVGEAKSAHTQHQATQ